MPTAKITRLEPAPQIISNAPPPPIGFGYVAPKHDVADDLPPAAAERLHLLRERVDDLRRRTPEFGEIQQASIEKIAAQNALTRLTSHPADGGFGRLPDDALVVEAQKALDRASTAFNQIRERQTTRSAAWQSAGATLSTVETFLRGGRPGGTAYEVVEVEVLRLGKNETVLDAIEKARRHVRELKDAAGRIAASQFPASYTKAKMREQIARLAEAGAPGVSQLVEADGDVVFGTSRLRAEVFGSDLRQAAFAEIPRSTELLCWLFGDTIAARLDKLIDAEAGASEAGASTPLSHGERETATSRIMLDVEAIERQETELVLLAQSQGLPVEHRADIGVLALLGLRLITHPTGKEEPKWPFNTALVYEPAK